MVIEPVVRCIDRGHSETAAEHPVVGRRRAAALDVTEHRHSRLEPCAIGDLVRQQSTDPSDAGSTPHVEFGVGDLEGARGRSGAFGHHHDGCPPAALVAADQPLTDLGDVEGLFGDQGRRCAAGQTRVHRDVADMATHDLHHHDPIVRFGRRVEPVDEVGGDLDRGVEPEGVLRARDVVVDRLRDPDDRSSQLGEGMRRAERSIATDDDEAVELPAARGLECLRQALRQQLRCRSTRAENGAATREDAPSRLDVERHAAIFDHAIPAREEPDDLVAAVTNGPPDDGPNHRVESRAVTTTGQHTELHAPNGTGQVGLYCAPMAIVISIDAGTTGVRSFALDESGAQLGLAYREFTQHYPRPGWVEHDADEIWRAVQETLAEVVDSIGQPVAAIGITDQRETLVAWSRSTGEPRHRAIVWQDRRTAGRCDELVAAGHLDLVRRTRGLVLDPYFTGTKAEWLLGPGGVAADDDLALGTIDTWLIWKLSGGRAHVTDPSNASRTLLYDIVVGRWSEELCDLLGVPISALAEVRPSSGRFAETADTTALGAGIPISGVAGDQQSALFGQACLEPGMTKNTYGTGSFVLMNVGRSCPEPVDGLLTTVAWDLGDGPVYALEGAVFVTGAAIQWLRDGLGVIGSAPEIGPLAASVPDSGGTFFVPAFAGLGSPWWDPYARGTIVGLTGGTTKAHLARATVEAMALQSRDVIDAMAAAGGHEIVGLRVDGGAAVMDLLLQIQADQLGVTVSRPTVTETTALGAAMLAGLAEGVWGSTEEVSDAWHLDQAFEPNPDRAAADTLHSAWLRAVERARHWDVEPTP